MENNQNLITADLQVDAMSFMHLKETAMWSRFLGIAGFIVSGLYLVVALFAGTLMSKFSSGLQGGSGAFGTGIMTIMYLIFAAIGILISLYMLRFGKNMKTALLSNDQDSLQTAFLNLKLVYRFYGIIMIIGMGFMVLALIGGISAALFVSR